VALLKIGGFGGILFLVDFLLLTMEKIIKKIIIKKKIADHVNQKSYAQTYTSIDCVMDCGA
jgi:hypothetical protein